MAGGRRYKFQGSTIAVLTDFGADSPSHTITGITRAVPAVVTSANHGLEDGDVIKINNVLGMTEANGVWIVNVLTSSTYQLVDSDSSAWGVYTSGGNVEVGSFSNFCELTGYNRTGGTSPEIAATSLCSTAQEFEIGLPDFGTTQLDFNFAPQTAIQIAIADFYSGDNSGNTMAVKVVLPNSGGTRIQLGFIQQTSEQAAANGLWTGSMTIRNTGPSADFA